MNEFSLNLIQWRVFFTGLYFIQEIITELAQLIDNFIENFLNMFFHCIWTFNLLLDFLMDKFYLTSFTGCVFFTALALRLQT
jgi:hypothetical protein